MNTEYKTRNIKAVVHVAKKVIWKNLSGEIFQQLYCFWKCLCWEFQCVFYLESI